MAKKSSEIIKSLESSARNLDEISRSLDKPKRGVLATRGAALVEKALDQTTKSHRVSVDLGGGTIAHVSTEFINWAVRALGNWSGKDSWMGKNADVLQGAPHVMIGLAVYLTELLTRPNGKLPTFGREVASEAANVFTHLGFANLVRALRVRWADGKVDTATLQRVAAERDAALAKLAASGGAK
jgi:hypothetical protein